MQLRIFFVNLGLFFTALASSHSMAFDHSHKGWNKILGQYLVRGSFNYSELKKSLESHAVQDFKDYLHELERVTAPEYDSFSKSEQMSFLINAYNAFTIKLILDHYPVKSIRDIGGIFKNP
jgi:hypothetical protein